MLDDTPEMAEVIESAIDSKLLDVHTSIPGRIQSYDENTKRAVVEVMTNRFLETESGELQAEAIGVIQNVRVSIPKAGDWFVLLPVKKGVTGQLFFTERSFGQWAATGNVSDPEDAGNLTMSGASFQPGGLMTDAEAEAVVVSPNFDGIIVGKAGGTQIQVDALGVYVASNALLPANASVAKADVVDKFNIIVDAMLRVLDETILAGAYETARVAAFPLTGGTVPLSASSNLKVD